MTKGNGLIEMSTLIAIVLGLIYSGPLVHHNQITLIAVSVITVAILGYAVSTNIPSAPSMTPDMKISWNTFTQIRHLYSLSKKVKSVHLSIIGISWFWFVGAVVIAIMPTFTKYFIHGDANVATALLVTFVVGTSLGAYFLYFILAREK